MSNALSLFLLVALPALAQNPLNDPLNENVINLNSYTIEASPPNAGTVQAVNRHLEIVNASGPALQGLLTRCKIAGDFDVQVDYILLNYPAMSDAAAGLSASDLHTPSGTIEIDRSDAAYRFGPPLVNVATNGQSGTLRLVRSSVFVTGYYSNGNGFTPLGIVAVGTGPTAFDLHLITSPDSPANVSVGFKNFIVNKGVPVCPADTGIGPNLEFLGNFRLVSRQPAGNAFVLTYRADLTNSVSAPVPIIPPGTSNVVATITGADPFLVRAVPGQDHLIFNGVTQNSVVTSSNTFSVIISARDPFFDPTQLQFTFLNGPAAPIANAGPNQTVPAGTTVMLHALVPNPADDSLTYSYMFVSRPPGSNTKLFFTDTPAVMFVADVPGVYVLQLMVANGASSSLSLVTVTTTP